ncbi:MAG: hypothetical protein H5U40_06820 [Polyangiaceae bacterium]|nr:hypothetical protein [Polyangiaceae bacterium]
MDRPARVLVADGTPHEVLLEIAGEPAGVLVPRGLGAVVALSSATPFENEWLSEGLGGVFFFRLRDALAPSGSILFDEYHLGVGASRSLVQYLRSLGAGPIFAQLGFAIALLLFRLGARLGRPVEPSPPRAEGSDTFVEAVGGLYERSGDRAAVVEVLRRRALARIARHHRVDSTDADVLAKSVAGRVSELTERAISALGGSSAPIPSDRAMIERARAIDALTADATSEPKRRERTKE